MLLLDIDRWILINNVQHFETETIYANITGSDNKNDYV